MSIGTSACGNRTVRVPDGRLVRRVFGSPQAGSGDALTVDPKSYARYDTFANVIDSIDTEGASRAYRRLRPLFQRAFDELGYTSLTFDDRLALALGRLVDTPVPEGDVALRARPHLSQDGVLIVVATPPHTPARRTARGGRGPRFRGRRCAGRGRRGVRRRRWYPKSGACIRP